MSQHSTSHTKRDERKEAVITKKIMELSNCIKEEYPELSTYFNEMPADQPNNPAMPITKENLKEYFDSLTQFVNTYSLSHSPLNQQP